MGRAVISYVRGDATAPNSRPAIIVHVCNDVGAWGKGFVLALSARWPAPEQEYKSWAKGADRRLQHGEVQFVEAEPGIEVANLIGQRGIRASAGVPPVRYASIEAGLARVAERAAKTGASVHMPRIGCGLAGGRWEEIEPLIGRTLSAANIPVTVYDF